jgi:hypothetical protein
VPISRERAVDLSHRMIERVAKTGGVELAVEKEYARNQILQALLAWDRESEKLADEVKARLRARRVVEGSRDWDLAFASVLEKALGALATRGE